MSGLGRSKKNTITSQALPSLETAPIPTTPTVATTADAAQIEANNADVRSLIGRDTDALRRKQSAYNKYLGANKNNMPTLLGQ